MNNENLAALTAFAIGTCLVVYSNAINTAENHTTVQTPAFNETLVETVNPMFSGVVSMQRDAEPIEYVFRGEADVSNDAPNQPDSIFAIGSITKSFTAAAVLRLVDTGTINLSAPVHSYIPNMRPLTHEGLECC